MIMPSFHMSVLSLYIDIPGFKLDIPSEIIDNFSLRDKYPFQKPLEYLLFIFLCVDFIDYIYNDLQEFNRFEKDLELLKILLIGFIKLILNSDFISEECRSNVLNLDFGFELNDQIFSEYMSLQFHLKID